MKSFHGVSAGNVHEYSLKSRIGKVSTLRRAQVMSIHDADAFFRDLTEKVMALEELAAPHPLSAQVAVANLKRYLTDDRHRIRLHDLVMQETGRLFGELSGAQFPTQRISSTPENTLKEITRRLSSYEKLSDVLLALMITGCYWGNDSQKRIWATCLEQIANPPEPMDGLVHLINLKSYPALLLLYSGSISAIASNQFGTLFILLHHVMVRKVNREETPILLDLHAIEILDLNVARSLPGLERHYTPIIDHLYKVLRQPQKEFLPDDVFTRNALTV